METTRPPGFPGNPPARMPRASTPARSLPPRPLRSGDVTFRPTHDVGPRTQCMSGLNHAAYGLPVNASRPGSPQAHASLGSGWRPTLAGWDWLPTGFRTRFQRSHHGILSPLTGLSRHTRWCMARSYGTGPPSPERGSRHSVTVGHAEPGHRVENPAGESHLHALPYQRATRHGSADDRLVPIDRVLDHGAPAVACSLGPLAAAEFVDRADVPVPLLQRSRRSWTQLGIASRWNAHSDGSPVTLCVSRLVDALGVVRAVCRNRGHALVDLTKQGGSLRAIAQATRRQS